MSRIAEARKLADRFTTLAGKLTSNSRARLLAECPLAFSLAEAIGQELVTQVNERGLAVLDNGVKNAEEFAARPVAPPVRPEEEPIFAVGTTVLVRNKNWSMASGAEKCITTGAVFDGYDQCFHYIFSNATFSFEVMEGDLDWEIEEFCAGEDPQE